MKKTSITIRAMEIDDLHQVYVLGSTLFSSLPDGLRPAWNNKTLAEYLADNIDISFVASNKKHIIAFIIGSRVPTDTGTSIVNLFWLGVPDSWKDSDLSSEMLRTFIECLQKKGIEKIQTGMLDTNDENKTLFRKFGFTESKHIIIMENFLLKEQRGGSI